MRGLFELNHPDCNLTITLTSWTAFSSAYSVLSGSFLLNSPSIRSESCFTAFSLLTRQDLKSTPSADLSICKNRKKNSDSSASVHSPRNNSLPQKGTGSENVSTAASKERKAWMVLVHLDTYEANSPTQSSVRRVQAVLVARF